MNKNTPSPFSSILFHKLEWDSANEKINEPGCFSDLNLDQVVAAITTGKDDYQLVPYFHFIPDDLDLVHFRQEVFQDLEKDLLSAIESFAEKMRVVHRYLGLAEKLHYRFHKEGWFLEGALTYIDAVTSLLSNMKHAKLRSRGLISFQGYLDQYCSSDEFESLSSESKRIKSELSKIQYLVNIKGSRVRVRKYEGEIDYTQEIEQTFEKFKLGDVRDFSVELRPSTGMNHVHAKILLGVSKLFEGVFQDLENFACDYMNFVDGVVSKFEREIQFYVSYIRFIQTMNRNGLVFSQPELTAAEKDIRVIAGFDIALANKVRHEKIPVVCNDFYLEKKERILVVSGPNQGGKTTFARMFGQMHYLAGLGCPVPAKKAKLFLSDHIFTHFEREEDIRNLRGKLKDDLVRIKKILEDSTSRSIIILNEIFTSTTLKDAVFLSSQILERIMAIDSLCVCVTFLDEVAHLDGKVVSMVGLVNPDDPSLRTYQFVRKPADGLAYAICIAEKYALTYDQIKERMKK